MKKLIVLSIILMVAFSTIATAQAPQKVNYQAVVRNAAGNAITDKTISLRISILQGSAFGTYLYVETHSPLTNQFGLVSLTIGDGKATSGSFTGIDWSTGPYFLKVELDAAGGTSYSEMGTTQLLSVPYSLYSQNSGHSKTAATVEAVDYSQLKNKPDLSVYTQTAGTGKWDKDSTNDVTLKGNQIIEGKKSFSDSLIVQNTLKAKVQSSSGKAIIGENISETGMAFAVYASTKSSSGRAIYGLSPYMGVVGVASASDILNYGVYGTSNSGLGSGVYGYNGAVDGKGIYGVSGNRTEKGYGVYGVSQSSDGYGVYGINIIPDGTGVYGYSGNSSGSGIGVKGVSDGVYGKGVYGSSNAGNGVYGTTEEGVGVRGFATSDGMGVAGTTHSGRAVNGVATASTGNTTGIFGAVYSSSGTAVYGLASNSNGITFGVKGFADSQQGTGLLGSATSTTGTNYGVKGYSYSGDGYDFYAGGSGVNYGAPSSSRWKSDVVPMTGVLSKIKKLEGIYFTWDAEHGGKHDLGFLGEEVAKYFPEVVAKDPEAPGFVTGMDYGKMTPILLQAINEQQVIIETQNKQILDLLKRVEALETK